MKYVQNDETACLRIGAKGIYSPAISKRCSTTPKSNNILLDLPSFYYFPMGCFSSKAKVATCTGTVTNPKTEARGVIKITCPKNLPSSRTVKVMHVDHGRLNPSQTHHGGGGRGGGEFPGAAGGYWEGRPLFVTFPKEIQEGQIWEVRVDRRGVGGGIHILPIC